MDQVVRLMSRTFGNGETRTKEQAPCQKGWIWGLKAVVGAKVTVLDTIILNEIVPRLIYTDHLGDVVEMKQPDTATVLAHFQHTYNQSKVCHLDGPFTLQQVAKELPVAKGFVEDTKWAALRWEDLNRELGKVGELKAIQCMRYSCKHKAHMTIIQLIRAKGEGTYTSTLYVLENGKARIENDLLLEEGVLASTVEILHSIEKQREVRVLDLEVVYLQDENKRLWLQMLQKCIVKSQERDHVSVSPDTGS